MNDQIYIYKIPDQLHRATVVSVTLSSIFFFVSIFRGNITKVPFLEVDSSVVSTHLPGNFVIFCAFLFSLFGLLALILSYFNEGRSAILAARNAVDIDIIGNSNVDELVDKIKKFYSVTDFNEILERLKEEIRYNDPRFIIDRLECQNFLKEKIGALDFDKILQGYYESLPENVKADPTVAGYIPSSFGYFCENINRNVDALLCGIDEVADRYIVTPEKLYHSVNNLKISARDLSKKSFRLQREINGYRSSVKRGLFLKSFQVLFINIFGPIVLFTLALWQAGIVILGLNAPLIPDMFR